MARYVISDHSVLKILLVLFTFKTWQYLSRWQLNQKVLVDGQNQGTRWIYPFLSTVYPILNGPAPFVAIEGSA